MQPQELETLRLCTRLLASIFLAFLPANGFAAVATKPEPLCPSSHTPPPPPAPTKALPKQALATRVHPAARPSKSKHKSNHKRRHKSKPWSCCAQGSRQSYSKSCTFSPAMAQSTKIRAASSSRCTTSLALSSRCLRNCTPAGAATSRWPTTAQANRIWALSCTTC